MSNLQKLIERLKSDEYEAMARDMIDGVDREPYKAHLLPATITAQLLSIIETQAAALRRIDNGATTIPGGLTIGWGMYQAQQEARSATAKVEAICAAPNDKEQMGDV